MKNRVDSADLGQTGVSINGGDPTDRQFGREIESQSLVYTMIGKHDIIRDGAPVLLDTKDESAEDREDAYAKQVLRNGRKKYFIKRNKTGQLYNPYGIHEGRATEQARHTGSNEYEYKEVPKEAFTQYVSFLKTRNSVHLKHAERAGYLQ